MEAKTAQAGRRTLPTKAGFKTHRPRSLTHSREASCQEGIACRWPSPATQATGVARCLAGERGKDNKNRKQATESRPGTASQALQPPSRTGHSGHTCLRTQCAAAELTGPATQDSKLPQGDETDQNKDMGSRRRQPRSDVDTGWYGYRSPPAASSSPGTPETLLPSQQSRTYGHMRIPHHTRLPTEHWKPGHLPFTGPRQWPAHRNPLPREVPCSHPRACLVAPRTHGKCLPGSWLQLEVGPLFVFQLPLAGQLCPVCYTDPTMASPRSSSRYSTWAAGLGPASAQSIGLRGSHTRLHTALKGLRASVFPPVSGSSLVLCSRFPEASHWPSTALPRGSDALMGRLCPREVPASPSTLPAPPFKNWRNSGPAVPPAPPTPWAVPTCISHGFQCFWGL